MIRYQATAVGLGRDPGPGLGQGHEQSQERGPDHDRFLGQGPDQDTEQGQDQVLCHIDQDRDQDPGHCLTIDQQRVEHDPHP